MWTQEHERTRLTPARGFGGADLLAVIGHDLRQPLSAASAAVSFVSELLEGGECAEVARAQIELAHRCMHQALLLAEDLLAMGQVEAGALQLRRSPVEWSSLLDETRALLTMHARAKRVELLTVVAPSLPKLLADHDRLLQVLANVCGNAVKFTPAGGRVTLAAKERGAAVEVSVTDSGPGIPADDLPHVFDAYWRSDRVAAGAGLGLAIARWLVEAHGGRIEARAPCGGGLTIAFTIPTRSDASD
jgi:signal transduction histidine kinase